MNNKTSQETGRQNVAARIRSGLHDLLLAVLFFVIVGALGILAPRAIASSDTVPIAVVITEVQIDPEAETLTVLGRNFDIGNWGYAQVGLLDISDLTVRERSSETIIVEFPGAASLSGSFVLTVKTGEGLEHFDAHPIILGDSDPAAPMQQLLIRDLDVSLGENVSEVELIIAGYNFDNGDWPPVVTLGANPLVVDTDQSDEFQLVAYAPKAAFEVPEDSLLQIRTGSATNNYDAMIVYGTPANPPPPDDSVMCSLGVCWKNGPPRYNLCSGHPRYYELVEDYELDLSYFKKLKESGDPGIKLPRMANRYDRNIDQYFQSMVSLPQVLHEEHLENGYKWDFVSLVREGTGTYAAYPTLKIKKGYRWDGTTRPCRRFDNELRSGLVHDAMYDLIRSEAIPWKDSYKNAGKRQRDRDRMNNRELADMMFYWTHLQDRSQFSSNMPLNPDGTYYTLQHDGMRRASFHIEKDAEWRFHTSAKADISASDTVASLDADGNRKITLSCALPEDPVRFDASASRPISGSPIAATHGRSDLHETTWEWLLNDAPFIAMTKNTVGQQLDRDELISSMTISTIESNPGWQPGSANLLSLLIDNGKGETYFENSETVALVIEKDTVPPVITGISEPINAWPPNHKYRTFTVRDFVFSITDDCSEISIDDVTIHHVTSNEPEDAAGDGHTGDDIVVSADRRSVDLRIERQGSGNGRVYTVYVEAIDESGNSAIRAFQVYIPHDHGQGIGPDEPVAPTPPAAPISSSTGDNGDSESGGGSLGWMLLGVLLIANRQRRRNTQED